MITLCTDRLSAVSRPAAPSVLAHVRNPARGLSDIESPICSICGLPTYGEGRTAIGKTWCRECYSGREPPVAFPPTLLGKARIKEWLAPRKVAT